MGRAVGVRVSGERSAVGAGHARPARVRQTGACGKAARRGQDPSLQDDDNGCFVGSGLDRSAGCARQTAASRKAAGRACPAPTNLPGGSVGAGVLDAPTASRKLLFQNQRRGFAQSLYNRCARFPQFFRRLVAAGLQNAAHAQRLCNLIVVDGIADHDGACRVKAVFL